MSKLEEEANKLCGVLKDCDFESIVQTLNKYSDKSGSERLVLVLEDYLRQTELDVPFEVLLKDVFLIESFFPEYDRGYLLNLLEAVGNETNRLKVVAKFLVNDKRTRVLKRGFNGAESQYVPVKKVKKVVIDEELDIQSSSIESNSTIIYKYEDVVPQPSTSGINEDRVQENVVDDSTSFETPTEPVFEFTPSNVENLEVVPTISTLGIEEKVKEEEASNVINEEFDVTMQSDQELELLRTPLEDLLEDNAYSLNEQIDLTEETEENSLVYPLMEIFPEACPLFIRNKCKGKKKGNGMLDSLISDILETDYPKRLKRDSPERVLDATEQLEIMKSILVDADPDYLQMHCDRLIDKPDKLKEFIENAIETRNYPTLKEFLRNQQISAQQKQYTSEFSVEKFLEVIPNPFDYFRDSTRNVNNLDYQNHHYALCYLRNKFNMLPLKTIREIFTKSNRNFLKTCYELDKVSPSFRMKTKRMKCVMPNVITNIPLLQEIAFFEHQSDITACLSEKKIQDEVERAQTKAAGLMKTCSCCFDDEVMPKDVLTCERGCVFCRCCVRKSVEVAFGDGKLNFPCLADCSSHFSLQVLQAALTPKVFSAIALKKQVEEVKAAGIEDLETCPFCDFVTIPARDDRLFRCLNPECMKESCRQCREPSHVPLRCEEVEKDHDVKKRTYIENKMTEALLRTCYKCGMKFIKEDGCNKMTCSCGALMCYVCGKPVLNYQHFNGLGGDKIQLCPLYSDTKRLHRDAVLKGAEDAKHEIGVTDSELKIDPTLDIQNHYKVDSKTRVNAIPPLNPFNQLPQNEVFLQQRAYQLFEQQLLLRQRRRTQIVRRRGSHRDRST